VFSQSGLPRSDLERIWTLADPGNKGKLDRDEFAVALHLVTPFLEVLLIQIYRRLNGYDIPVRLPPELIPPSSRAFANAAGQVKSFLRNDITARQKIGLTPQATGYNKARSFRDDPASSRFGKKDAAVYRFNDNEIGYTSSARRRGGGGGGGQSRTSSIGTRSPSPPVESSKDQEIQRLRKEIREKQILLDAVDIRDEASNDDDSQLDRRDREDADDLYRRIRRLQDEIDSLPQSSSRGLDSAAEKRAMRRQLQGLSDRLPKLASDVRDTERRISDAKLRLFRMKDAKEHPGTAIQGTGPNGEVTEGDRRKAKANAMLQARMAQLTGKPVPATSDDFEGAARRLAEETERVKREREGSERMIHGIEESAEQLKEGLERSLKEDGPGDQGDHERRRWEEALGVEDEVRDFIFDLQRQSRDAKAKPG
jgi:actin cytoskeleton-regulatory complex protein PAN1